MLCISSSAVQVQCFNNNHHHHHLLKMDVAFVSVAAFFCLREARHLPALLPFKKFRHSESIYLPTLCL